MLSMMMLFANGTGTVFRIILGRDLMLLIASLDKSANQKWKKTHDERLQWIDMREVWMFSFAAERCVYCCSRCSTVLRNINCWRISFDHLMSRKPK
jgi:hypothetical protein